MDERSFLAALDMAELQMYADGIAASAARMLNATPPSHMGFPLSDWFSLLVSQFAALAYPKAHVSALYP